MSRIAFFVAGRPVYWYGILIAAALLTGTLLVMAREKRFGLQKDDSLNFVLWAAPVAIVCARLYYVAFSWDAYKDDLTKVFALREGGLAIYGAVLGGLLTAIVFAKKKRIPLGSLCDLCAPALVLGQAIGRWGNFFNQEAFGRAIADPRLQFFPMGVYIEALGEWHWATFFYESCWCALIFLFLMWGEHRRCFRRAGDEFMAYAVLYAAERCVVEGLRTDSLMLPFLNLRVSQVVALASVLIGVILLVLLRNNTHLTGCGAKKIMELNNIEDLIREEKIREEEELMAGPSTIFGDMEVDVDESDALGDEPETKEENAEEKKEEGEEE